MRTKRARNPSATWFRRSRRQARYQGLRPAIVFRGSPSAGANAAASAGNSLWVFVAIFLPPESRTGAKTLFPAFAPASHRLLHADGGEVELVQHVVDVAAQVHLGTKEVS